MLADDEHALREAYTDILTEEYAVVTAADGDTAVAAMTDDVDVVIVDRRMPGLSGEALLDRLRDDGYDGPIIIVSAVDPDNEAMERSVDAYLFKPVSGEQLLTAVEKLTTSHGILSLIQFPRVRGWSGFRDSSIRAV